MEHLVQDVFPGFSGFEYTPVISHERGISRRDPSPVVRLGETFYVWYSKSTQDPSGYAASVWYAASPDGRAWREIGEALPKGSTGAWDEHGVFTPTVFIWDGTYYLVYTGVPEPFTNDDGGPEGTTTAIGMAAAASPDGPWRRVGTAPILVPADDTDRFDSHRVDDACVVRRDGKFWLYYKGRQAGKTPGQTKMGLARSDHPTGPYARYSAGPVVGSGHEVCAWPHGKGVAAIMAPVGPDGSSLQYSSDGLSFAKVADISPPKAPGPYRLDRWEESRGPGITWGISMEFDAETKWPYLVRFDADLRSERPSFCEKQNLFEARTADYHVYRIPGLLVTKRGTIVAHCEARKGNGGDWDPIDICMRRSTDGGVTWGGRYVAMDHTRFDPDKPINNFTCFADQETGDVHVLFSNNYARVYYMKSEDDCLTFGEPRDITPVFEEFRDEYPWQVVAVGPGHSICLKNGRLIGAVWMSDGSGTEFGSGRLGHRPSEVAAVYSDDHGETWHAGDFVVRNTEQFRNPNETCAVELSDGRVLFNTRTESDTHRRLISMSPDGATGWSTPEFDHDLVEPICFGSIIGFDERDRKFVFANPGVLERTMPGGPGSAGIGPEVRGKPFDRKNLTVRLSEDDCRTWSVSRLLEDGPSGYSDLAVLPDGTLLCLYECGIVDRMYDDRYLRFARFTTAWMREGSGTDHSTGKKLG